MVLLRAAALVTLMRGAWAEGPGRFGARGCVRRGRQPAPGLSLALRRRSAPPQPLLAATEPFPVELKAGKKYAWCSCGHSKKQPFCDGAHKQAAPGLCPVRFSAEEDARVWLCGCKRTRSPPYCDGSHKEQAVQGAQLPPQP